MRKTLKMVLYGEPGEGKSTFVSKSKNPFYISTDGNFEWLDLPEQNHKQIFSFTEFKNIVKDMIDNPAKYAQFDVIAVDLIEDVFKWCEFEYCKRNRVEHVGDIGYGKGYDISRNEFYIEICKLLGLDKHVVLIAHGFTKTETNNRGVNVTKYLPSDRIPSKVWDMIEGRVRYFLRAFSRDEETSEGKFVKRRYLSLIPKQGEYGISRGLNEAEVPEDIDLDWNTFVTVIGLEDDATPVVETQKSRKPKIIKTEQKVEAEQVKEEPKLKVEQVKAEAKVEASPIVEEKPKVEQVKEESMAERIARIKAQFGKK